MSCKSDWEQIATTMVEVASVAKGGVDAAPKCIQANCDQPINQATRLCLGGHAQDSTVQRGATFATEVAGALLCVLDGLLEGQEEPEDDRVILARYVQQMAQAGGVVPLSEYAQRMGWTERAPEVLEKDAVRGMIGVVETLRREGQPELEDDPRVQAAREYVKGLDSMVIAELLHVDIDYDEGDQATYQGVEVRGVDQDGSEVRKRFETGDPARDYEAALDWAHQHSTQSVLLSSSCDHFTADGDHFGWWKREDGAELIFRLRDDEGRPLCRYPQCDQTLTPDGRCPHGHAQTPAGEGTPAASGAFTKGAALDCGYSSPQDLAEAIARGRAMLIPLKLEDSHLLRNLGERIKLREGLLAAEARKDQVYAVATFLDYAADDLVAGVAILLFGHGALPEEVLAFFPPDEQVHPADRYVALADFLRNHVDPYIINHWPGEEQEALLSYSRKLQKALGATRDRYMQAEGTVRQPGAREEGPETPLQMWQERAEQAEIRAGRLEQALRERNELLAEAASTLDLISQYDQVVVTKQQAELRRPKRSFGIAVGKDADAREWQQLDAEERELRQRMLAVVAQARQALLPESWIDRVKERPWADRWQEQIENLEQLRQEAMDAREQPNYEAARHYFDGQLVIAQQIAREEGNLTLEAEVGLDFAETGRRYAAHLEDLRAGVREEADLLYQEAIEVEEAEPLDRDRLNYLQMEQARILGEVSPEEVRRIREQSLRHADDAQRIAEGAGDPLLVARARSVRESVRQSLVPEFITDRIGYHLDQAAEQEGAATLGRADIVERIETDLALILAGRMEVVAGVVWVDGEQGQVEG